MQNVKVFSILIFFILLSCSETKTKNIFSKKISEFSKITISISDFGGATDGVTYYICLSDLSNNECDLDNSFFVSYRPELIKTISDENNIYIIQRGGEISKFNSRQIIFRERSREYIAYIHFDSKILPGKFGRELN